MANVRGRAQQVSARTALLCQFMPSLRGVIAHPSVQIAMAPPLLDERILPGGVMLQAGRKLAAKQTGR